MTFYNFFRKKKYHIIKPFIISIFIIFFLKLLIGDYMQKQMSESYELSGKFGIADKSLENIFVIESIGKNIFPNNLVFSDFDLQFKSIIYSTICREYQTNIKLRSPIIDTINSDRKETTLFKIFFNNKDYAQDCDNFLKEKFINKNNIFIINKLLDYKKFIKNNIQTVDSNVLENKLKNKDISKGDYFLKVLLESDIKNTIEWNYLDINTVITKIPSQNVNSFFYAIWIVTFLILLLLFNFKNLKKKINYN